MGNKQSTSQPAGDRAMGDSYPGAADPYPTPSREEAVVLVMQFTGVTDEGIVRRVLQDNGWDANAASQSLLASGGLETMEFTLPTGTVGGQKVYVQTPRGQCEVDVPEGMSGGDVLIFRLPIPTSPPAVAIARPVGSVAPQTNPVAEARSVAAASGPRRLPSARMGEPMPPETYTAQYVRDPRPQYYQHEGAYAGYELDVGYEPPPPQRRQRRAPGVSRWATPAGSMPPAPGRQFRFL